MKLNKYMNQMPGYYTIVTKVAEDTYRIEYGTRSSYTTSFNTLAMALFHCRFIVYDMPASEKAIIRATMHEWRTRTYA